MSLRNWLGVFFVYTFVGVGLLPGNAQAVPSYARQTGMACAACHTTPPELTPFGRDFKINGYVMTGMQQIEAPGKGTEAGLKISEVPPPVSHAAYLVHPHEQEPAGYAEQRYLLSPGTQPVFRRRDHPAYRFLPAAHLRTGG
jgi:hypothetical protein